MKNFFRRVTGRPVDSFDQVTRMTTRKLPIPDLETTNKFVRFTAKRTKEGYWEITSDTNMKSVTAGFQLVQEGFQNAVEKHLGQKLTKGYTQPYNFDTAFLILRDMEESLLKRAGSEAKNEPDGHYMAAYRLLPRKYQEGIDDIHQTRTEKAGPAVAPKDPPIAQPAAKPQQGPKPN